MSLWIIQKYWPVSIGTGALGVNKSKSQLYAVLNKLCGRFERYRVGSQRRDVVGRFLRASLSSFSVFVALSFRRVLVFTAGIQKKKKKRTLVLSWLVCNSHGRARHWLFVPKKPRGRTAGRCACRRFFHLWWEVAVSYRQPARCCFSSNVGIVPDHCAAKESRAGGTGLFNLRVYQHSNSHLRSWDLSSDRKD